MKDKTGKNYGFVWLLWFSAIFLLLLLMPCISEAQEVAKIAYVAENEAAPFSGYLLTSEALAQLKVKSATESSLMAAKVKYEVGIEVAELRYALAIANANLNFCQKESSIYKGDVVFWQKKAKRNLWEKVDMPVGVSIGFVASYYLFTLVLTSTGDK